VHAIGEPRAALDVAEVRVGAAGLDAERDQQRLALGERERTLQVGGERRPVVDGRDRRA
jgi:hypothetical protein